MSLSVTGIGWSRGREVSFDDYDQIYRRFNPAEFEPTAWVSLAQQVGFKWFQPVESQILDPINNTHGRLNGDIRIQKKGGA